MHRSNIKPRKSILSPRRPLNRTVPSVLSRYRRLLLMSRRHAPQRRSQPEAVTDGRVWRRLVAARKFLALGRASGGSTWSIARLQSQLRRQASRAVSACEGGQSKHEQTAARYCKSVGCYVRPRAKPSPEAREGVDAPINRPSPAGDTMPITFTNTAGPMTQARIFGANGAECA